MGLIKYLITFISRCCVLTPMKSFITSIIVVFSPLLFASHLFWPILFRLAYLLISVKRFYDTTDFPKRLRMWSVKKWIFNHDKSVGQSIGRRKRMRESKKDEKKVKANVEAFAQVSISMSFWMWKVYAATNKENRKNLKSNLLLLIIPNDQCQRDHFFSWCSFFFHSLSFAFRKTLLYYSRWMLPFSTWWQITRKDGFSCFLLLLLT